jgi:5-methylcytosine-specific restriction endonuclease McrA
MSRTYIPAQLSRTVSERANGCCEYCLQPEIFSFSPHEVDHAIAEKHGGATTEDNLAFACKICNTFKSVWLIAKFFTRDLSHCENLPRLGAIYSLSFSICTMRSLHPIEHRANISPSTRGF